MRDPKAEGRRWLRQAENDLAFARHAGLEVILETSHGTRQLVAIGRHDVVAQKMFPNERGCLCGSRNS